MLNLPVVPLKCPETRCSGTGDVRSVWLSMTGALYVGSTHSAVTNMGVPEQVGGVGAAEPAETPGAKDAPSITPIPTAVYRTHRRSHLDSLLLAEPGDWSLATRTSACVMYPPY